MPCSDPDCASFYTTPPYRFFWRLPSETITLAPTDGQAVDLVRGKIVCVEIIDRLPLRLVRELQTRCARCPLQ
jgi:hypothetical protein